MEILQSYSLREHNTFGIDAQADWFIPFASIEDLQLLSRDEYFQECRCITIGEGSNLLFLTNFHGIVLHSVIQSIERLAETADTVDLLVGSGVKWDDFVAQMAEAELYGVENLSLIPGEVGAAAVQNIGAYGAEICEVIREVHTVHRRTGEVRHFAVEECNYSYRHSFFKEPEAADYIVTHVLLRLSKHPHLKLDYADLRQRVEARTATPTARDVRDEVIRIRQEKLPDPKVLGNEAPHYDLPDGQVKVPAGWLIDRCGLKGYRLGHATVYERQALVLVNADGEATGQDIARLAEYVQEQVAERFGLQITPEVRYIS